MSQSLSDLLVHVVFSTKHRQALLRDRSLRSEMHAQLAGASKTLQCPAIIVGGVEDHIHLLARMSRTIAPADWIKEIKRVTSIWVKTREPKLAHFAWQAGYGAFSVSRSNVEVVSDYIRRQEEHHAKFDFQTEFRSLLQKHEIDYDERYVWD